MAAYDNLRTLLRLQSPANLSGDDPYMARRRADIVTGLDDMVPGADSAETRAIQHELGQRGIGVSREAIREDPMTKLRQALGLGQAKHEQARELQRERGEQAIRQAREQAEIYADRARLQSELSAARMREQQGLIGERSAATQEAITERAGAGRQQQTPTDTMEKRLSETRSRYRGGFSRLQRSLGMSGGREDYANALTSSLTRMGLLQDLQVGLPTLQQTPGDTLDEKIINAGGDPNELHPYEREWLELQLGR